MPKRDDPFKVNVCVKAICNVEESNFFGGKDNQISLTPQGRFPVRIAKLQPILQVPRV